MNETDNAQAIGAAGPAPGGRLAEARRAQNMTPADVARQLKLSLWQVEALEAGRYEQLPGPIFVRGFIRNYARLLKLDPGDLLLEAGERLPQPASRQQPLPSPDIPFPGAGKPRWPALAAAAAAIVGILAVYEFYWNEPEPGAGQPVAIPSPSPKSGTVPGAVQTVAATSQTASPADRGDKAGSAQIVPPPVAVATAPPAVQDTPPAAEAARPERGRSPGPGERQVHLVFEQESWVEIRDREERVIFSQLNQPGTQQYVSGLPPFSVVVGNAHGVRMTFDEKPVDLARHTRTDVARLTLQ